MVKKLLNTANELSKPVYSHLRLFAGNPECVSNKLYTTTLLEHLSGSNVYTVFIERHFSYPVALQLISNALHKPSGIAVFEWIEDLRYMAPLINLLEQGFTVLAGLDAADENQARQLFQQLLSFTQNLASEPTPAHPNPAPNQTLSCLLQGPIAIEVIH